MIVKLLPPEGEPAGGVVDKCLCLCLFFCLVEFTYRNDPFCLCCSFLFCLFVFVCFTACQHCLSMIVKLLPPEG